jgi:hypothetical protein
MEYSPLLQRGTHRAVQAVLQEQLAAPLHDVSEQIPVEGRVLRQLRVQVELTARGDQLVEPHLPRCDLRPASGGASVVGVRAPVSNPLEDHPISLPVCGLVLAVYALRVTQQVPEPVIMPHQGNRQRVRR